MRATPHRPGGRQVGVSVSDEFIRLVALAEAEGGIVPVAAGVEATPNGAVRHGSILQPEQVAAVINRLLTAHGLLGESVRLAVDGEDVIVRILELPVTGTRELYTSVLSEIEDFGLFGPDEAAVGWQVVEQFEREGVKNTRVLVAAAQRQMVRAYQDAVTRAGAVPAALEAASLTSLRAVGAEGGDEAPRLVVRLTPSLTEMAIVANQKLLFSHGFAFTTGEEGPEGAGDDFLALGESWESLAAIGIGGPPSAEAEVRPAAEDARLQEVLGEVLRSLAFFERRFTEFGPMRSVVVLADAAHARPTQEALQPRLPIPVEVADPLRLLYLPDTTSAAVAPLVQDVGAFAAAFGAALGGFSPYKDRFAADLFPRAERREGPRVALWTSAGVVGLTVLLLLGSAAATTFRLVRTHQELNAAQAQAADLEKQFPGGKAGLDRLRKAIDEAQGAVESAENMPKARAWSKTLEATVATLPPGTYLTRMAGQGQEEVSIEGTAASQGAVTALAQRLMATGAFRQVMITSVERISPTSESVKFKLACEL